MKTAENISSPYGIDVKKYSAFNKLIRTTAWINRFINNLKYEIKKKGPLSNEEIEKTCHGSSTSKKKLLVEGQRWKDQTKTLVN